MADRAIIRISALADSGLRRALNGTVDAARKASRQVLTEEQRNARVAEKAKERAARAAERASERAANEQIRDAKRVAREQERETKRAAETQAREAKRAADAQIREARRSADAQAREAERAEDAKRREMAKTLRVAERAALTHRRETEKTARTQIREAEKAARAEQKSATKSAETRQRLMLAVGAGAYGAVRGSAALVGRGQGLAGSGSLEDRLTTAGDFRAQLIRSAGEARLSPDERAKVEANLLKVSEETNTSIMDLVSGLQAAQTRFNKFKEFNAIIGDLARVSQATGEPLEDLIGAIGTMSEAYRLDEPGQREIVNAMIAMSERGAIAPGDFARSMASKAGTFQVATGRTGVDAAREFMATAQVIGTSQAGASESATMLERFAARIGLPDVQGRLRQIGVKTTGADGQLLNIGDIGAQLATNERFQQAGVRKWVFPEDEARNAAQFIMSELQRDPMAFTSMQSASAEEGAANIARRNRELANDPMFRLRNVGIRAQADTVRDADRIVKTITPAIEELTKLQVKFPLLTESVDTLESTVKWAVGTLLADRFIRGGTAFGQQAGEALGKTASVSLGKAFSDANWAGKVGMAGQLMATGFLAYMTTDQILKSTGWDAAIEGWGASLYEALHGGPKKTKNRGGKVLPGKPTTAQIEKQRAEEAALAPITIPGFSMVPPENALPSPMIPAAEAKLVIEVVGPGKVKSVDAFNTDVDVRADTGRRSLAP